MDNQDLIKIKEDAIKIQINDLQDTIKSIENENIKSSFILGFAGILFSLVFDKVDILSLWQAIVYIILLLGSIGIAFWNITAKKVNIHINVDEIFVNNEPKNWERYLNFKHLRLRENYQNAKNLLYQKANYTRLSFVLLILSAFFLRIIRLF
ncbi:hypothetical protein J7L09_01730 [bacterium]|nr:hypothetical protein [bacterium]